VKTEGTARERLLAAAYELFAEKGIAAVGVDAIVERSGCAKASLYKNFESKTALALAFLERREELWTRQWLETETKRRASEPEERLLAIFDVFDEWFRNETFEGCSFVNVLLESGRGDPIRSAATDHLASIRAIIREFAVDAGLAQPDEFAQTWHMLMKGSIVSAGEGNAEAARQAKRAAALVLDGWPRADAGMPDKTKPTSR